MQVLSPKNVYRYKCNYAIVFPFGPVTKAIVYYIEHYLRVTVSIVER